MLGWIVQRVSGTPYERFVKDEILEPLRMTDTFFFPSGASAEHGLGLQTSIAVTPIP